MQLDRGDRVLFTNTVRSVETSEDGYIIEYGPILGNTYIHIGIGYFKNVDHPHHTIKWHIYDMCFNETRVVAGYEILY